MENIRVGRRMRTCRPPAHGPNKPKHSMRVFHLLEDPALLITGLPQEHTRGQTEVASLAAGPRISCKARDSAAHAVRPACGLGKPGSQSCSEYWSENFIFTTLPFRPRNWRGSLRGFHTTRASSKPRRWIRNVCSGGHRTWRRQDILRS